ncbi:hypothetical protein H0H87_005596 [Tephrocybe sp. NHM501043]|nr:hypothetical protein H0H87_005596 [Tephrocybe sp. NHM501043]
MTFTKGQKDDSDNKASSDIDVFRKAIHTARHIVVLSGMVPHHSSSKDTVYEEPVRNWQSLDASPEAFATNSSLVWQLCHSRRRTATRKLYSDYLAKLTIPSFRTSPTLAPKSKSLHIIFSSTDRLLPVALDSLPRQSGVEKEGWDPEKNDIPEVELPHCLACGVLARPGVVHAGERPPRLAEIDRLVRKADLCIIVGNSQTRHPAAAHVEHMRECGGKVAVFVQSPMESDEKADFLFEGDVEHTVPMVLGLMK